MAVGLQGEFDVTRRHSRRVSLVVFILLAESAQPQRPSLNETKKIHRRFQFTLRRALGVLTITALAVAFAPKLWNARLTAPRRIDVQSPGTLDLVGTTVQLPIEPETVESFYVWDGGTYGVSFVDNAGVRHVVASWQPLGQPEHHGDILIGGMTPDEGGTNVGRIQVAERLIFSAMELEDQSYQSRPTVMEMVYPTNGLVVTGVLRHLADWIRIW